MNVVPENFDTAPERTNVPSVTRKTRQKDAIRQAFTEADRPLSPEEALAMARTQVESMSIATIYRNIGSLVSEKWLTPVEIPGEPSRYELAGKKHHHHFRCNDCGKIFELDGCVIPVKPQLPRGFQATGHEFYMFGTCTSCSRLR